MGLKATGVQKDNDRYDGHEVKGDTILVFAIKDESGRTLMEYADCGSHRMRVSLEWLRELGVEWEMDD